MHPLSHLLVAQWLCMALLWRARGAPSTVQDLKRQLISEQRYMGGCYKLLNRTGAIGCAAPGDQAVQAQLLLLQDLQEPLTAPRALLVPSQAAQSFLQRLSSSPSLQQFVTAVLVYDDQTPLTQSWALPFAMGAEYAPYSTPSAPNTYIWNPAGSSAAFQFLQVPVFRLTDTLAQDCLWRAAYNQQTGFSGASHWVMAELTMSATQSNSSGCLTAGTCWPLGGFSVWAAMPPLPTNATSGRPQRSGMPVTLVVASIDSNDFFHDFAQGADGPLSGLVSMLAAMSILQAANQMQTYTRQLVFVALAGEPWNYMGSKRLLWDLQRGGTPFTAGLSLDDIDQVIEVGQVGRGYSQTSNSSTLYLHAQPDASGTWGNTTTLMGLMQSAAVMGSGTAAVNLAAASAANPGLPPSSLYSFLRVKPSITGVLLTEFDRQFINPYFHSSYDNGSVVFAQPMVAAAAVLARTLHALAAPSSAPAITVNNDAVLQTVLSLAQCMLLDSPGMSCPTATALLNPDFQVTDQFVSYAVKHYLGVLQYIHPDPQEPYFKKTIYRFLWNFMGQVAAVGQQGDECAFAASQCAPGLACIGWKGANRKNKQLMGRCWRTTVGYTPALSTALDFVPNSQGFVGLFWSNASAAWEASTGWPQDPVWTESNWPLSTPSLRVMLRETHRTEAAIMGGGVAACVLTAAVTYLTKAAFERKAKSL